MSQTLLFQVDQGLLCGMAAGFGPGLPAGPALASVWASLEPLRRRGYKTVLAFTPVHPDFGNVLVPLLDTAVGLGASYCLDQLSSDTLTMPEAPWRRPYLQPYGMARSFQEIKALKERHGASFAGLRFHEWGFWYAYGLRNCTAWLGEECQGRMPVEDDPFYPGMALPLVRHFHGQGGFVCISDPSIKPAAAAGVRQLTDAFPQTVIPCYANNLAGDSTPAAWLAALAPYRTPASAGYGLSAQGWRYTGDGRNPDLADLAAWVRSAAGASLIEFEPAWMLWNVPGYDLASGWQAWGPQHDGAPLPALAALMGMLP